MTEKVCRFRKNQAVNLQQIPLHANGKFSFGGIVFNGFAQSGVAAAFSASIRFFRRQGFAKSCAAKFLQTSLAFFLPERIEIAKANIVAALLSLGFQRLC